MNHVFKTVTAVVLSIIIVTAVMLPLSGCGEAKKYADAAALAESGDWEAAREAFYELGFYMDADDRVTECDYELAKEAMEEEDYESAEKRFEELGDYEDSAELLTECRYNIAMRLFDEGNYDGAFDIFSSIEEYKESHRYGMICMLTNDTERFLSLLCEGITTNLAESGMRVRFVETNDSYTVSSVRAFRIIPSGAVSEDEIPYKAYLCLLHSDKDGRLSAKGDITSIMIFCEFDGSDGDAFGDASQIYMAGAYESTRILAGDEGIDEHLVDIRAAMTDALTDIDHGEPITSRNGTYKGLDIYIGAMYSDGQLSLFHTVDVPELMQK